MPNHENTDDWVFGDASFSKLYGQRLADSSLLDCSVATRWVFVWMLSQADAEGRYRCASVKGLARASAVSLEEATQAVAQLSAPDPDSTSKDCDGRRIERIAGGWRVVNYERYRDHRSQKQKRDAERKREQREMDVPRRRATSPQTSDDRRQTSNARESARTERAEESLDLATDPELIAGELFAEINRWLPDQRLKVHPGVLTPIANLLLCGHPDGITRVRGDPHSFTREDLFDAAHGYIVAETEDKWHIQQRECGSPYAFARLVRDPGRLAEYAEKGRKVWERWKELAGVQAEPAASKCPRDHGKERTRMGHHWVCPDICGWTEVITAGEPA